MPVRGASPPYQSPQNLIALVKLSMEMWKLDLEMYDYMIVDNLLAT